MPVAALAAPLLAVPLLAAPLLAAGPAPPQQWRWPLVVPPTPVVARQFEPPAGPYGPGHRGVDLAAAPHATVLAAGSGTVSFAGLVAGTPVVSLVHVGGLRTTYEPVVADVRVGQQVTAGQPIGALTSGHGDCGPGRWCLHWGLIRDGGYVDPLSLLHLGPARLLPLTGRPAVAPAPAVALSPRAAAADTVTGAARASSSGAGSTAAASLSAAAGLGALAARGRRRQRA